MVDQTHLGIHTHDCSKQVHTSKTKRKKQDKQKGKKSSPPAMNDNSPGSNQWPRHLVTAMGLTKGPAIPSKRGEEKKTRAAHDGT
jgi:hypothetical protein